MNETDTQLRRNFAEVPSRERLSVQLGLPESTEGCDRTATLTWYTGAAVRRYDGRGAFEMRFSMEPGAIRMQRLGSGAAPLLNSHRDYTVEDAREAEEVAPGVYAVLFVKLADLPGNPQRGDVVEVDGVRYKLFDIEADASGAAVLRLRQVQ